MMDLQQPGNFDPNHFDNDLRAALRRREPPAGFSDRVIARIPEKRKPTHWHRRWLAVAAASCIAVIGAGEWKQRQRQIEGERAKRELIYALTVASESLQTTKQILTR